MDEKQIENSNIQYNIKLITLLQRLDKFLGQLGIYATWLSSFAYLQTQLRIFIFYVTFFSVITSFLIA